MRPVTIAYFLMLLCWRAGAQSPPPQPTDTAKSQNNEKCVVAGTVVRLDTGEPLKKATVILRNHDNVEQSAFAITDAQGRFQFDKVELGTYSLDASHNGFVKLRYGQKKHTDPGANLSLAAGQKIKELVFKQPRTASVTGREMGEDWQPLPTVPGKVYQASTRRRKRQLGAGRGASPNA